MNAPTDTKEPVRFSHLKHIAKSPAHYLEARKGTETAAYRRGRATHLYMLGNEDAVLRYEGRRAGKAWDAFRDSHPDDEILIDSELRSVDDMREALQAHRPAIGPSAMELLTSGRRERRIRWTMLGRLCQGTPDVAGVDLVDLKTTRCADPARFARDARWMHYHVQLAWYADALALLGTPVRDCWIVAVESKPPYPVQCFKATDRALECGRRTARLWLERLLSCEAADSWPAYLDGPADFDIEDEGIELKIGGATMTVGGEAQQLGGDGEDEEGVF